jgi:hypothetical protein
MTRRKLGAIALVPITAVALALGAGIVTGPAADAHGAHGATDARTTFHDAMRKLWEDHITWTRMFIVSAATETGDLPDLGPTVDRLLANQTDIGDAIKPFYGDAAGDQLTTLLREHILTAADLVGAAKAGDEAAVTTASEAWYANADEIATFLSEANPRNWPLEDMKAMMREHLDLTLEEAVARLQGRYADDIVAYDKVHDAILEMADMLSDGIVAQFPEKFAR